MRTVLITGSRKWTARTPIWNTLHQELRRSPGGLHVIHGGAEGADDIADRWAWGMQAEANIKVSCLRPDYLKYPRHRAPLIRNAKMAALLPDICHAFPLEGSGGTRQCMTEAFVRNIEVVNHGYQPYTKQSWEYARAYGSILKGL